ncbi:MAG: Fic family protein [Deltaproteobacteria bacterium]|nr:Fic family protein [Deltaproteobacteria bacterium]
MTADYEPPCTLTAALVTQVARIAERAGARAVLASTRDLRLRRSQRVRTVQSSLAIEGNTLDEEQITAILEGKRVVGPPREILEAKNALDAYERMEDWDPSSIDDLLRAHGVLMAGLVADAGAFRSKGVGVVSGERVIHMAPPAIRVHDAVSDLVSWLAETEAHPLLASSLFHYELEFIHPFSDGNGRMGRLWQTLILTRWNPLFTDVPVESQVRERQPQYYAALNASNERGDAEPFVSFMLSAIEDALDTDQVRDQVTDQVAALLEALQRGPAGTLELLDHLGLSHRPNFRANYLRPALDGGWIERTQPDAPRSPTQKYRLTPRGKRWLAGVRGL